MPLSKEQLLIPRYLCTGTPGKPIWPGSIWRGGDIIEESIRHGDLMYCDTDGPRYSDFPHLFRPMPWWYWRKPEEMPDWVYYISMKGIKEVRKVIHWEFFEGHWMWKSECGEVGNFFYYKDDEQYQPATEQEYNEYQKQKEAL